MAKTKRVKIKKTLNKPVYDDFGRVMTPSGPVDNTTQILERIRASRDNLTPLPTVNQIGPTPYMPQVMPNSYERYAELLDPQSRASIPVPGTGLPSLPFDSITQTGPAIRPYMPLPFEPRQPITKTVPDRQYGIPEKSMPISQPGQGRAPQPAYEYFDASYTPQAGSISDRDFAGFIRASQPVNPVTQTYGQRSPYDSFSGGVNYGVDYRAASNTPVTLPKGNYEVVEAFYGAQPDSGYLGNATNRGYGNSVLVKDLNTGEKFRFSHLNKVGVKPGQKLQGGEIGLTGATGNVTGSHLDLEYYDKTGKMADIQRTPYASQMWQKSPSNKMINTSLPVQNKQYAPATKPTSQSQKNFGSDSGSYFNQLKQVENALSKKQQPTKQIQLAPHSPAKQSIMNALSGGQKKITDFVSNLFGKKK